MREAHPNSAQLANGSSILLDAADEIERLQSRLHQYEEAVKDALEFMDGEGYPNGDEEGALRDKAEVIITKLNALAAGRE